MVLPNAVLCIICAITAPDLGYGQNDDFWNLPVKASFRLRAKRRFLKSARKKQPSITGKTTIFGICP
ncbi:hypothetical protein [Ligilactobacillus ruminis]|uniref:hypothetical protein n=1 Tax=Ligilactobacillus ruminis TaxID=1623 RepID=UPI003F99B504